MNTKKRSAGEETLRLTGWYFLLNESSTVHVADKAQLNLYYEC